MSDWSREVTHDFEKLAKLEPGWDGGSAKPIVASVLEKAGDLLSRSMRDDSPAPSVVADPDGALSLEWRLASGIVLEVDFDVDGDAWVGYSNKSSDLRGEWEASSDIDRLTHAIDEIAAILKR